MYIQYIVFLVPALLVSFIGYYLTRNSSVCDKVSTKELLISLGANLVIALFGVGVLLMYVNSQFADVYYLTGKVTSKERERVSCEHSYQICTTSGKTTTCTTHYEHAYDIDWVVHSTVGDINIDRVDRQGTTEPKRWSNVIIGEPFTRSFHYNNYLLADPDSLFNQNGKQLSIRHPGVYDYYRYTPSSDPSLNTQLRGWSIGKKINPLVYVIKNKDTSYFYNLMKSLQGGKINDVVLVYSLDKDGRVQWMKVGTYALGYKNKLMESTVSNIALDKVFSKELVFEQLSLANKMFTPLDEEEFKDKKDLIDIPMWLTAVILMINLISSIGIHIYMKREVL